jgi:hypothetical protein
MPAVGLLSYLSAIFIMKRSHQNRRFLFGAILNDHFLNWQQIDDMHLESSTVAGNDSRKV